MKSTLKPKKYMIILAQLVISIVVMDHVLNPHLHVLFIHAQLVSHSYVMMVHAKKLKHNAQIKILVAHLTNQFVVLVQVLAVHVLWNVQRHNVIL
jgi:hypothetical protein